MSNSPQLPNLISVEGELCRRSLRHFARQAWRLIEPNTPFSGNWHIDAILDVLQAVVNGEILRVLINTPPRHGKSSLCSVIWLAWAWLVDPSLRLLTASYAMPLALRDANRSRRLIESTWYRDRWGDCFKLMSDQNAKGRFENDRTGLRIATSVGGSATGEGGDIILIDDPHKLEDAFSAAARQTAIDWYSSTISSRLNDQRTGRIVVIGQRIHEHDLSGHLIESGDYEHICLPAEYEPTHPFLWPDDPRTEPDELLWPQRIGPTELERLKRSLGPYAVAGQLQQRPAPADGGVFNPTWWQYYDPNSRLPRFDEIVASCDLAFTGGPQSDYVVLQLWGVLGVEKYLLQQVRARMSFVQTLDEIEQLVASAKATYRRPTTTLIEHAANGAAAHNVLRKRISSLILRPPDGNKLQRAHAVAPQLAAGNVFVPGFKDPVNGSFDRSKTPAWVQDLIHECASFPRAANDDQVDALAQALAWIDRPQPRIRTLM